MKLIGINGLKKSGKDTSYGLLRDMLAEEGKAVERRAFADKLKIMAALALGYDREPIELIALMDSYKDTAVFNITYIDPDTGEQTLHDLTGREYLQHFGNKARTVFGDTFWIDQVLPNPATSPYKDDPMFDAIIRDKTADRFDRADFGVVTDCRYPNEAQRVLDLGGEIWEITRPGLESDGHVTEQPLPAELVTRRIVNDGTISQLADTLYIYARTI